MHFKEWFALAWTAVVTHGFSVFWLPLSRAIPAIVQGMQQTASGWVDFDATTARNAPGW